MTDKPRRSLIVSFPVMLLVSCSLGFGLAARAPHDNVESVSGVAGIVDRVDDKPQSPTILERTCRHIYRGEFEQAADLIAHEPVEQDANLASLLCVIEQYDKIEQRRRTSRREAYQQQLAELDQLRSAWDSNDPNVAGNVDKVLSVVVQAREFATDDERQQLLSDPFVQRVVGDVKAKAAELESHGKWFEAYMGCYYWLPTIWPDNSEYSDHAKQLVEKANIASSFQDSPCESSEERYERVQKGMFIRAIDALNFNYVNVIDYRQMAVEAIHRCKLLAEVMRSMSENAAVAKPDDGNQPPAELDVEGNVPVGIFEPGRLSAWSAALSGLRDEVNQSPAGITKDKLIDVLEKVLAVSSTTLELPQNILIAQFAEAALSALDPYTVMVWPRQVEEFEKEMMREFTGIGIEITKQRGLLTVASLLPETPAYRSGLDAGDVIEKVDGVATKDMSLVCAVRLITGPAGTKVRLTVRRIGEESTREIPITRAKITVPTIRGWRRDETGKWLYFLDREQGIGYVRLTSFTAKTASDLEKVLKRLEAEGMRGLILDLRLNTGGLLDSAVDVTDKFLEEGLIVKTQPRFIPTWESARKAGTHPNYPLVLLINRFSASASEIVSGALQDEVHNRAVLVGERTHGKGSVQGITPYPGSGAQLKYTMAYYHLPSGQRVESQDEMKKQGRENWGVAPDIEIQLTSGELKTMLDLQRENDVLVRADHDNGTAPLKRHGIEETLEADPQLAVAILVVKAKLIQQQVNPVHHMAAAL